MIRAEDLRDQRREMKYLVEEEKLLMEMLRKVEDQGNRLRVQACELDSLRRRKDSDKASKADVQLQDENLVGQKAKKNEVLRSNYLSSGTPSRPVAVPLINITPSSLPQPNAVVEPLELDVGKVLLTLACGGKQIDEIEEYDDDD